VASREVKPSESHSFISRPDPGDGSFSEVHGRSPKMCRLADVPFPASNKAEACIEKIGHKTIRGPWRFEFDAPAP
jgi:hypothetical protein